MLLLHVCCAPCLSKSLAGWRRELGLPLDGAGKARPPELPGRGWFFNPNIHPLVEFRRRLKAVGVYGERDGFPVEAVGDYGLDAFLDDLADAAFDVPGIAEPSGPERRWRRPERCLRCHARRLDRTARKAKDEGCEAFATTLAASREQDRASVEAAGRAAARRWGVPFFWRDWREEEPPERLVKGLYRQAWCGCVFSERDRYERTSLHLYRSDTPDKPGIAEPADA